LFQYPEGVIHDPALSPIQFHLTASLQSLPRLNKIGAAGLLTGTDLNEQPGFSGFIFEAQMDDRYTIGQFPVGDLGETDLF
jgi:hypothetical protein